MRFLIPILLFLFFSINLNASDDDFNCLIIDKKGDYREHQVDFKKLILNIEFNTENSEVLGSALYTFTPLRKEVNKLFLDAPYIQFESVKISGKEIKFEKVNGGVNLLFTEPLVWEKTYNLSIDYKTNPQKGLYFVGWNDKTNRSRKQIWTQGQGIDNRHWIPGYDGVNDKLITETIIKFETGYEVISNGELVTKKDNNDNTTSWHYAMEKPHALYLVMLAIGEYEHKDYSSNSGIISRQYYYPDKANSVETTYQYSTEMMNWFEKELGVPYQWEIYKNVPVQDFMYGAMENTSATIYTDYYLRPKREALERTYIGTNAHELAHNWFGDFITEWSGTHHWLHESFATHYSKRFIREALGEEEYQWAKRREQIGSLSASKRNNLPVAHTSSGSSRHYSKGSFVIDMLRYVVGEEHYKKTITEYLNEHALDMVDTHDFQLAFMKTLGMNLDWFFNQWIYKGGEPEYRIEYKSTIRNTTFYVEQIHEQNDLVGLFKMPIKFQVHYKDGSFEEQEQWIESRKDTIEIQNNESKKVEYVIFDPNAFILKRVKFKRTYKELIAQATKAINFIDRYDAIEALDSFDIKKKRNDLIEIYLKEENKNIKTRILAQFKEDKSPKAEQLFVYAISDKVAKVRKTGIKYADFKNIKYQKLYEALLEDESYINIENALVKLCKAYPEKQNEYLIRTENIEGKTNGLHLTWLKLSYKNNEKLIGGMVDFCSESYEFRTRIKAFKIIREVGFFDRSYMINLVNGYLSFNRRLKNEAKKDLVIHLSKEDTNSKISEYIDSLNWLPYQKEKLNTLLKKYEF